MTEYTEELIKDLAKHSGLKEKYWSKRIKNSSKRWRNFKKKSNHENG